MFTQYDNVDVIKLKNIATVLCYEKSVLIYEKDGLYGLIDFNGKELTKNIYSSIENLKSTEGKFLVCKDDKYGVINLKGNVLVDTEYDQIETDGYYTQEDQYTKSGFIVAVKNSDGYKYGYINYKGDIILDVNYNEITRITAQEDIYLIAAENGQYGLYLESKELIENSYQSIEYCDNGVLIIQKNANYGVATLNGDTIIETKYSDIEAKGIYLYVKNSETNQVYDTNGNVVNINFSKVVYETDNEDYRVVTLVNNDITYYGIESSDGTELVSMKYRYIEYAYNDYFIAKDDDEKLGVIDSNGNVLIDFEYDMIQKLKGKDILQTLNTEDYQVQLFSSDLNLICSATNALVSNNDDYVSVSSTDVYLYFDSEGNEIDENADVIKKSFPDTIGDFSKVQESLNEIYYTK